MLLKTRSFNAIRYYLIAFIVLIISIKSSDCESQVKNSENSRMPEYQKIADLIYKISVSYKVNGRWKDAVCLLENGIEIMSVDLNNIEKAKLQSLLGLFLWKTGKVNEALNLLNEAKNISESTGDKKVLSDVLYNIGEIFYIKKFYMLEEVNENCLEYTKKALDLKEEINDKNGIPFCLSRIGVIYERYGKIKKAQEYYKKAVEIGEETGNKIGLYRPLTHIGAFYFENGNKEKGLEYFYKALSAAEEAGDAESLVWAYCNVGFVSYNIKKEFDKTLEYYLKALSIIEKINDKLALARTLNLIGKLYKENDDKDKAFEYYKRTIESVKDFGYKFFTENARKAIEEIKN